MNKTFQFLASTILIMAAFLTAGWYWNSPLFGLALGLAVSTLVGILFRAKEEQWILFVFLISLISLMYFACYPLGFLWAILSFLMAVFMAAFCLRYIFGGSISKSLENVFNILFKKPIGSQTIAEPTKFVVQGTPDMSGPRKITVKPETAIVLESGYRQTEVRGPQSFVSSPSEYVRYIFSLKPHYQEFDYTKVLTEDIIATRVTVGITYGLDIALESRRGSRGMTDAEIDSIRRFSNSASNWQAELKGFVEADVRRTLGGMNFRNAVSSSNRQLAEGAISRRVQRRAIQWGIRVYRVLLINVQPESSVSRANQEKWIADTKSATLRTYEKARANAWRDALGILSEAYSEARDNDLPNVFIYRELFRRMFELAASDSTTRNLLPRELRNLILEVNQDDEDEEESGAVNDFDDPQP